MTNFKRAKPGRYGVESAFTQSEKIAALTSASTDTFRMPTPFRKAMVVGASAQAQVLPIITTGTSTATLKKFRASDGQAVTLSAGLDLETTSMVANKAKAFTLLSTATEADLTVLQGSDGYGDTLYVEVVNGTTVATAPVALYFVVEFSVLE